MKIEWKVVNANQTAASLQTQLQQLSDDDWILFEVLAGDGREADKIIAYKINEEDE